MKAMHILICLILLSFLGLGCGRKTGTVTDIDGNVYQTVKIGDQWWMAENLRTTHYRDGTPIPNVKGETAWRELTNGAYCYNNNDSDNAETYGALYNWYVVNNARGLAPEGWRVATDDDWKALEMFLGMSQSAADSRGWRGTNEGQKLKSTSDWWEDGNGTDEVGFAAFPGGYRNGNGYFSGMGIDASFWSASEYNTTYAWQRWLHHKYDDVSRIRCGKYSAFSVRCVKDYTPDL